MCGQTCLGNNKEMLNYLKLYFSIRKFGKKRSYLAGTNNCVHVSRELTNYNNMVFDIDWVLTDARQGVNSEDYILPQHNSLRCSRKDILRELRDIDNKIVRDINEMQLLMQLDITN